MTSLKASLGGVGGVKYNSKRWIKRYILTTELHGVTLSKTRSDYRDEGVPCLGK